MVVTTQGEASPSAGLPGSARTKAPVALSSRRTSKHWKPRSASSLRNVGAFEYGGQARAH